MEEWRDVPGFEGLYKASNFGIIKSLSRKMNNRYNTKSNVKGRIIKLSPCTDGYLHVALSKEGNVLRTCVHQIIAKTFLSHTPCRFKLVVNHKDFNRHNNSVDNLEIVTHRVNTNKKHIVHTSEYTGVCWDKKSSRWKSQIKHNGNVMYLGHFINEIDAHNAYENAKNGSFIKRRKYTKNA